MDGWEDPTLTGPNMGLKILKRENLQLSRILRMGYIAPKGHVQVFKRDNYHGISPPLDMVVYQSLYDIILIWLYFRMDTKSLQKTCMASEM